RGLEGPSRAGQVGPARQQQLALLAMKLRRVEALSAPLHGAKRLRDDIEGGPGLACLREGRRQQAQEVRLEVLRAQRANGRKPLARLRQPLRGFSALGQRPAEADGCPGLELDESPLAGQ